MKNPDYEYLGDDILHVYIPEHYPLRVKLMVLASLKTYKLGNKSILLFSSVGFTSFSRTDGLRVNSSI